MRGLYTSVAREKAAAGRGRWHVCSSGDVHHRPGAVSLVSYEDLQAPVHDGLGRGFASSRTRSSPLRPR
jgi:hypothetical protein